MIWFFIALMICVALGVVLAPLVRGPRGTAARAGFDLAVYKDQLREIDDEVARRTLAPEDADAARGEIKRRMLAVPKEDAAGDMGTPRALAVAVALLTSVGAVSIYLSQGEPNLPGHAFLADGPGAAATAGADGRPLLPDVESLTAQLAARLEKNPGDAEGWRMLGWSYFNIERYADAETAYARAVALSPNDADLHSAYAEAAIRAASGLVTPHARKIVDDTLALNPKDPRARFFRGLAFEQDKKLRQALDLWVAVVKDGPPDAEWMPGLRERVTTLARALDIEPASLMPAPPLAASVVPETTAGPSQAQVDAAAALPPEAQQAMVDDMVQGLARKLEANPKNLEGWLMLARSRKALGDSRAAGAALARARQEFAGDAPALQRIAAAARDLGLASN